MIPNTAPKCRACRRRFVRMQPMQLACSLECAIVLAGRVRVEKVKIERQGDRAKRLALKSMTWWATRAEVQVNRYVRLRDAGLGCISCDKPASWPGQWHASHYRSVGAAPGLRYHLWNINKACSPCNKWLSGNLAAYTPALIERIGQGRVDWLKAQNQPARRDREYLDRLWRIFKRRAERLAARAA